MSYSKIIIFGATSAIAQALARKLAAQGSSLFLVGRSADKLAVLGDDLRVRAAPGQVIADHIADLDQIDAFPALFDAAEAALGGLDAIVIAHGTLPDQAECDASLEATLAALRTNASSPIALAHLAANRFAAQRKGLIVAIGSVAGDRGRQSNYAYGTAKGALALYLQGLRNRLTPLGVGVLTVKPGFVDTPMTAHILKKGLLWAKPDQVAQVILQAMDAGKDVIYVPWFWQIIMLIIKSIPERVFKKLKL